MGFNDDWPTKTDGTAFDGTGLFALVCSGKSPFQEDWNVNLLLREIEKKLDARVVDIPKIHNGYNNYGFHVRLSKGPDVIARLARSDVNSPKFYGFPVDVQVREVEFEASVYKLLGSEPDVISSRLLYHRIPVQHVGRRLNVPEDIIGRRLMLFERTEGKNNVWHELDSEDKDRLLAQSARIRASLYNLSLPEEFADSWLYERLFEPRPESFPIPVASTRDFCVALLISKIEATIGCLGDTIGRRSENNTVGPIAVAARQSLTRLIPHIVPTDGDQQSLYRLTLDHGDFGIHNMSIKKDRNGQPLVTSLYDWETGCVVPAILSDPLMSVSVDLTTNEIGVPSISRVPKSTTPEHRRLYMAWARTYFKALSDYAPDYERAIHAGKDARHLWFALRDWPGTSPDNFFGALGGWAERRMKELGVE